MIFIYAILAWGISFVTCWTIISQCQVGLIAVRQMHRVPCNKCKYFTNSCYLKCTVNPQVACSEAAIDCRDYQALEQL